MIGDITPSYFVLQLLSIAVLAIPIEGDVSFIVRGHIVFDSFSSDPGIDVGTMDCDDVGDIGEVTLSRGDLVSLDGLTLTSPSSSWSMGDFLFAVGFVTETDRDESLAPS